LRIGIISDVHGNYVALRAVLEHMGDVDALWCLGDFVGYGPQPNECISAIIKYRNLCIPGNHDWGMLGRLDQNAFNKDALAVLKWTRQNLKPAHEKFLEEMPVTVRALHASFTLVHASPRDPMWEYLLDLFDAAECFPLFDSRYLFVGHTHVPLIFRDADGVVKATVPESEEIIRLNVSPYKPSEATDHSTSRMIINPGSVGQPRDGDPRAAYMLLDIPEGEEPSLEEGLGYLTFYRVEYPVAETQALMKDLGFPERLIS
jgi:predicted phosphodiesterase